MTQPDENIKPMYIPPSKRVKGLVVYCNRCNTNMQDKCLDTGKHLKYCPHADRHVFKVYVHIPGTKNERKCKSLDTRDLDEAIIQALEFRREVRQTAVKKLKVENPAPMVVPEKKNKPVLLIQAMAKYVGWLNNEGLPQHLIKQRSPEHIKDVERSFRVLAECLNDNRVNLKYFTMEEINDRVVGLTYSHLEKKSFSARTFNKYYGYYSSFINWFREEYNVPLKNCFEKVSRKRQILNPEAITKSEYEALLKQITPENGEREYEHGVKHYRNFYRPWLADGIRLALETGRRREEIINLKWNNIGESDGIRYIRVEDFKVNRIQHRSKEEKKFIYVPVTDSLMALLEELGFEELKSSDAYILAPDINISRNRVMSDVLSRGFSHYYNQLNTGRELTFKCLRKTYITNLRLFFSCNGDAKAVTGHSDDHVIENNYIDKREIAKASRGFKVFSEAEERTEELRVVRGEKREMGQELDLNI